MFGNKKKGEKSTASLGGGTFSSGIPKVEIPILVTSEEEASASSEERKEWSKNLRFTLKVFRNKLATLDKQLKLHRKVNSVQKKLLRTDLVAEKSDLSLMVTEEKAGLAKDALYQIGDLQVDEAKRVYGEKINSLRAHYSGQARQLKGGEGKPRLPF